MEDSLVILVAEDEPLIAEGVVLALEDAGFIVRLASSGEEAAGVMHDNEVRCRALITDIRVGSGPNGWELARLAREGNPGIPVVYISADNAVEHPVQGVPGSIMIQKPFVYAQVITAVTTLLNAGPATE